MYTIALAEVDDVSLSDVEPLVGSWRSAEDAAREAYLLSRDTTRTVVVLHNGTPAYVTRPRAQA